MKTPEYLLSPCSYHAAVCRNPNCENIAKEDERCGGWFITMGHAGFNSPANNRCGYRTKALAVAAAKKYMVKGQKRRAELMAKGLLPTVQPFYEGTGK